MRRARGRDEREHAAEASAAEGLRRHRKGCREAEGSKAPLTIQEDAPSAIRVPQEGEGQDEERGVEMIERANLGLWAI
jgi:hypothetical protein